MRYRNPAANLRQHAGMCSLVQQTMESDRAAKFKQDNALQYRNSTIYRFIYVLICDYHVYEVYFVLSIYLLDTTIAIRFWSASSVVANTTQIGTYWGTSENHASRKFDKRKSCSKMHRCARKISRNLRRRFWSLQIASDFANAIRCTYHRFHTL